METSAIRAPAVLNGKLPCECHGAVTSIAATIDSESAMLIRPHFFTVLAFACLLTAARADPLPIPNVDYASKAKMTGGASMSSRHANGKLRVEMQVPGMPQGAVAYIDLRAKKGVTVMSVPGMGNMAIEIDVGEGEEYGAVVGRGKRVGSATVAGETCELWEIEGDRRDLQKAQAVACITPDSIPLRMEANINGKREIVFEVTELVRGPQDVKLLTPPPNLKPMRLPKGMMPQFAK
jgi:hypothetical protein